jgi:uroporphyrinogen decarboxylase
MNMNPRERVLAAIQHQEPDYVPLALGGGPYGIVDELYFRLVKHLEIGQPVAPFRSVHSISYMDDRLLERLGTDIRYCWPGLLPNSPVTPGNEPDTFYDSYGQIWKRALPYYYTGEGILSDAVSIDAIDDLIHWPDLSDPRWNAGLAERARELHENTNYFVVMRMIASHGPFQTACDLRGTENFLMDLALRPEFAHALLEKITEIVQKLLEQAMQTGGKWFDMVELPGDDYAGSSNLILSPVMFRTFVRPCLEKLVSAVKGARPDVKIMLHSDGAITRLIPEFVSLGVDVIHPLEPLPATDINAVKAKYGDQVTFLGGVDISHAMPSSKESVIADVKRCLSQLASGGGYILAPSNHLQGDVPAENVVTLFEAARQFGKYPITL